MGCIYEMAYGLRGIKAGRVLGTWAGDTEEDMTYTCRIWKHTREHKREQLNLCLEGNYV